MLPKVSVCLITYNHEAYIRQCLDSIVNQKTDFDFEVIIGEDKSTDNTAGIVNEYKQLYPNLITVISPIKNQGSWINAKSVFKAARGKYLAYIEGDDYWISNQKLQKQADFLDIHSEFAMCFHRVEIKNEGVEPMHTTGFPGMTKFSIADLIIRDWFVGSCSMMVRRTGLDWFPDWAKETPYGDLAFQLMVTTEGDLGYIDETFGVYRRHGGGASQVFLNNLNIGFNNFINLFTQFNNYTNGKYWHFIKVRLAKENWRLIRNNPPFSKTSLKAAFEIFKLGPKTATPYLKHAVVSVLPKRIYKLYNSTKEVKA